LADNATFSIWKHDSELSLREYDGRGLFSSMPTKMEEWILLFIIILVLVPPSGWTQMFANMTLGLLRSEQFFNASCGYCTVQ